MKDIEIEIRDEWIRIGLKRCSILITPEAVENGEKGAPMITLIHVVPREGYLGTTALGPGGILTEIKKVRK